MGYVTVLYADQEGLDGNVNGTWQPIPLRENHFIVNLGESLDLMLCRDGRVNSIEHRVGQVVKERTSFGVFLDGNVNAPMYSYSQKDDTLNPLFDTYQAYMQKSFQLAYGERV